MHAGVTEIAVNERTGEIAVMKTLGFPAPRIFRMVLSESVMLSLAGGLIGLGLATLMVNAAAGVVAAFLPGFAMSAPVFWTGVGLAILLGLLTGIIPALKAQRVKIVTALGKQ